MNTQSYDAVHVFGQVALEGQSEDGVQIQKNKKTKQTERQTNRQTDRKTDRHIDRQTDGQSNGHIPNLTTEERNHGTY